MTPRAAKGKRASGAPLAPASDGDGVLRGVLFDLDDTVYDHSYALARALTGVRQGEPAFRKRSVEEVRRKYGELLEQFHRQVMAGKLGETEARVRRFQALFDWVGVSLSLKEAGETVREYRQIYLQHQRAVPGVAPLLARLADRARLGIVSNNLRRGQLEKLRAIGLGERFDVVMTSEEAGAAKPDPDIFQAALDHLGVDRDEAVMVGDSWPADILGARAAGIVAVWFNRRHLPNPDPSLAVELTSYSPATNALGLIDLAFRMEEE